MFHVFTTEHSQNVPQILFIEAGDVFECLYRIPSHERVEVVCFVLFCKLIANFQTCLEQIFKQFQFLRFPVKGGLCQ